MIPYKYIAIEGNIGAGKSTLAHFLHQNLGGSLLLEEFQENESLKAFYKNPDFALNTELQFVLDRSLQLNRFHKTQHNFIIADYIPLKSLIFASNNLSSEAYELYQPIAKQLLSAYPQPDLVIYLNRSIEELVANIKKRGRDFEMEMQNTYLQNVAKGYTKHLDSIVSCPILELEARSINLQKPQILASAFERILQTEYMDSRRKIDLEALMNLPAF